MFSDKYDPDADIQALATPPGESALAIIRLAGPETRQKFSRIFSNSNWCLNGKGNTLKQGFIVRNGNKLDQVVVSLFCAPASYTGQDMIEIYCHGNMPGIKKIQDLLNKSGFRDASPGEFTFRAFLNGKIDLTQAEAVKEIISSKTGKAHKLALERLSGGVRDIVVKLRDDLLLLVSQIEIQLDYPEDELDDQVSDIAPHLLETRDTILKLLAGYKSGKAYRSGARIALAGRTNTGKSSLFNLFLKEDRAIVSDIHGATRDYLEAWINIDGIPAMLIDTAGIREAENALEDEGIRRGLEKAGECHLVLYVIDGEKGANDEDRRRIAAFEKKAIVIKVWNKSDLRKPESSDDGTAICALSGDGLPGLENAIKNAVFGGDYTESELLLDSDRQKALFEECLSFLDTAIEGLDNYLPLDAVVIDIRSALDSLGSVCGKIDSADILEKMFSEFCVGK